MCGIAGTYRPGSEPAPELVREMVARMVHRGPDGEGQHFEDGLGLGVRRLAIIDPDGGDQPLVNEAGDVVCVFNGEIYNHAELRRGLERRGHRLDSGSDGAVLPHLYEELGEAFLERLNGIFAIALWDRARETLHLARDKLGVKPLYWSRVGGRLAFASELRALLADQSIPRDLDYAAIDDFLTFRFVPSPRTPLAAVRKLPPAGALAVSPEGVRERRWWTAHPGGDRRDRSRLVEEYADALERAIARQMMSDRPIGLMLSGGVDSAAVCAVMARHSSRVRTFTVGFSEGGEATDEIALARQTARRFGAEHESMVIDAADYRERLPESLRLVEEPVGAQSALAVHYVAELMRPWVPVALCGQGADEPLAGYDRYVVAKLARRLRPLAPVAALAARSPRIAANVRLRRGIGAVRAGGDLELLMGAYRLLDAPEKHRLYRPELRRRLDGMRSEEVVERLRQPVASLDPVSQMTYVDTRLGLPDELLLIADKMSMAASVELRVPFLDEDLVGLIESMHSSQKLRGISGKSIHKQAVRRWLPREIVYRRKRGFETPVGQWLRAELRPLAEDVLLTSGGLCRALFEERELRRMLGDHAEGGADYSRQLFCLLSLGLWHRAFIGEDAAPP